MGKFLEYEVVSPVEVVYPDDFHDVVEDIGITAFSVLTGSQIRMWSSGTTFNSKKNSFRGAEADKLRYTHYTKVEKNLGTVSLDFEELKLRLNSNPLVEAEIESEKLIESIAKKLHEETGQCSLEGTVHEFDYVDVIDSEKRENTKLFVLRQFTMLNPINGLRIITETVEQKIKNASDGLEQVDFTAVSALTDSIVLGWVENPSPDAVVEFKETLTDRFKNRGYVQARVTGLEINTAT